MTLSLPPSETDVTPQAKPTEPEERQASPSVLVNANTIPFVLAQKVRAVLGGARGIEEAPDSERDSSREAVVPERSGVVDVHGGAPVSLRAVWQEGPGAKASGSLPSLPDDERGPSSDVSPRQRVSASPVDATKDWTGSDLQNATIAGTYRVVRPLGSGGMGIVLLAEDTTLDRKVALKLIRPELARADFHDKFVHEARSMARVNHPNVAQVHTFGMHEGAPYLVMELVEGKTLETWLEEAGGVPDIDQALSVLEGICAGASAIHAKDTVHRDLKPSNVILDDALRPHIVDLGLAVLGSAPLASDGEIIGTPGYMAPEIVFPSEEAGPLARIDVYAIACIAYEMLTGHAPFSAPHETGMLLQHATQPVPLPSVVRPELGTAYDEPLLRGLEKRPSRRTPTPEAFCRSLRAAREGSIEPSRILLAEDDEDFRELVRRALASAFPGAEIVCVGNGTEALEAFAAGTPTISLLDLHMPDVDGEALTRTFRANESAAAMPILIFTGGGGAEDWKRLSELGADGFLVKPLSTSDMVALVRRTLHERTSSPASGSRSVPPPKNV
jgi:serine/threonine-protein kinase